MPLPVDTTKLLLICGGAPTPVVDRNTGEVKLTPEGGPFFRTEVVALGVGRPEVLRIRTPKEPKATAMGNAVAVSMLTVSTFTTNDGGTGVFYEATAIEPAKATKEASS